MFCTNCGTEVHNGANFCHNCGHALQRPHDGIPSANDIVPSNNDVVHTAPSPQIIPDTYDLQMYMLDMRAIWYAINTANYFTGFYELNSGINSIWESFEDEEKRSDYINTTMNFLFDISVYDIKNDLDFQYIQEKSRYIIQGINEETELFKRAFPEFSAKLHQFILSEEDASYRLATAIHQIINQEMGSIYSNMLNQLSSLQAKKNQWLECIDEDGSKAFADGAQYLAGGALAAAMPWVGIPALIGKYVMSQKNEETKNRIRNDILNEYSRFVNLLPDIISKCEKCVQRVTLFINEKMYNSYTQRHQALQQILSAEQMAKVYPLLLEDCIDTINDDNQCDADYRAFLKEQELSPIFRNSLR